MTKTETVTHPAAVGAPLECGVRPCAWMLKHKDGHWNTLHAGELEKQPAWVRELWRPAGPLYDQAALDAAVAVASMRRVKALDLREEVERLRALLRRALPMASALDATKTAVVWTADLQCDASGLVKDIRAALGPNVRGNRPAVGHWSSDDD